MDSIGIVPSGREDLKSTHQAIGRCLVHGSWFRKSSSAALDRWNVLFIWDSGGWAGGSDSWFPDR